MLLHAQLLFYYPRNLIVSVVHSGLLLVIVLHKKAAILSQVGIFLMSSKRGTELLSPNCQVECVCVFFIACSLQSGLAKLIFHTHNPHQLAASLRADATQ